MLCTLFFQGGLTLLHCLVSFFGVLKHWNHWQSNAWFYNKYCSFWKIFLKNAYDGVPWQWKKFTFYLYFLRQVFGLCKEKLEKGFKWLRSQIQRTLKWINTELITFTLSPPLDSIKLMIKINTLRPVCLSCSSFCHWCNVSANLHLKKCHCFFWIACLLLWLGWCALFSLCAWHRLNQLWALLSLLSNLWAPVISSSPPDNMGLISVIFLFGARTTQNCF